jgi:hypothetical protein
MGADGASGRRSMNTGLPFRFPVSASVLSKWQQLANEDKISLLTRFVQDSNLLYTTRHQPKLKQLVDVAIADSFAIASEQAAQFLSLIHI